MLNIKFISWGYKKLIIIVLSLIKVKYIILILVIKKVI